MPVCNLQPLHVPGILTNHEVENDKPDLKNDKEPPVRSRFRRIDRRRGRQEGRIESILPSVRRGPGTIECLDPGGVGVPISIKLFFEV